MEVIEMVGQTMAKVVPVTIGLALVFTVLSHFWAQARARHRHLLLVLRPGIRAGISYRAAGARRRLCL
jgi:hypothetical protein